MTASAAVHVTGAGTGSSGPLGRALIQSSALLVDAYRELDAKKLFWITMMLSGLVVSIFAGFGINEQGLTFLWWEFPIPLFNSSIIPPASFYKFIFASIGIPVWLTWVAAVLALISTAGIFPDFISGGSIELALSKPIGRTRLFLTKYFTGLLFVFLQVAVFTLACFLVIGIRGGRWDFMLFLAVPIVVCFYSYLYCFCVLMGLLTQSTIASVLLTCLFWILVFGCNTADAILLQQRVMAEIRVEKTEQRVTRAEATAREKVELAKPLPPEGAYQEPSDQPEKMDGAAAPDQSAANAGSNSPPDAPDPLELAHPPLGRYRADLAEARRGLETWRWWSGMIFRVKTALPKTSETVDLLNRYLLTTEERNLFLPKDDNVDAATEGAVGAAPGELARRINAATQQRSVAWIVGSSLVFEMVAVGIGAWIFARRDF